MYGPGALPRFTILNMSTPQNQQPSSAATVAVIISSSVVSIGVLAAAVALSLAGRDAAVIVGLIGPVAAAAGVVIAALGRLVSLDKKQDAQTAKLDEVAHQTNGALRAHVSATVRAEVRAALAEHFGPPAHPTPPTQRKPRR